MKEETDKQWELIEKLKGQRPACCNQDNDGHHTFVSYQSEGIKECIDCGYYEDIVIGVD